MVPGGITIARRRLVGHQPDDAKCGVGLGIGHRALQRLQPPPHRFGLGGTKLLGQPLEPGLLLSIEVYLDRYRFSNGSFHDINCIS